MLCAGNPEEQKPSMEPAEFDPTFHGPIHDRYCTDVVCCVFFLVVILGHVILGFVAWENGNPEHILYGKNSSGAFCGLKENADKPYLYYFNFMKCTSAIQDPTSIDGYQCPTTQMCVKKCPNKMWVFKPGNILDWKTYKDIIKGSQVPCIPDMNPGDEFTIQYTTTTTTTGIKAGIESAIANYIKEEKCPFFHIKTMPLMGRCVPDVLSEDEPDKEWDELSKIHNLDVPKKKDVARVVNTEKDSMFGFNSKSFGTQIFEDFAASWGWIVLGLFTSMLVSLAFLLLLRYTAPIMVWSVIVGTIVGAAIAAYFCHAQYIYLMKVAKDKEEAEKEPSKGLVLGGEGSLIPKPPTEGLVAYLKLPGTWLTFFIILIVLDFSLLVMIIFLRERLRVAVAIIQESSKAIGYMVFTLAYPVATFVLVVLCVGFWGVVSLYLVTLGEPNYLVKVLNKTDEGTMGCEIYKNRTTECKPMDFAKLAQVCPSARCLLMDYKASFLRDNLDWVHAYNLFATLWSINFVIALGQCTLAGAFASYYWAFCKPGDIPHWPLMAAFTRTMRYHVGSLAFGSLIITLLQIVRMILEYVDHKTKDAQNPAVKFLTRCLRCLFWLLENFLKFLNRNAYIMIAVYGKNFCLSAQNAFFLLLRNVVRVVVLDRVTDLLIFFGKLMVVGTVGTLFYLLFSGTLEPLGIPFNAKQLNFYWMPVITVAVGAYVIASGFFSVYGMCVDTLFLCFLEDLERNDGSPQKPYYMSSNLMNILGKSNQPLKKST